MFNTWPPQREVTAQSKEGPYLSCAEATLFTYVKDTIWSTVNLQRPAEPRLAAIQTPQQSGRGWITSFRAGSDMVCIQSGGQRSEFSSGSSSFGSGRACQSFPLPPVEADSEPSVSRTTWRAAHEAGLFWADVMPPALERIFRCCWRASPARHGLLERNVRDSHAPPLPL